MSVLPFFAYLVVTAGAVHEAPPRSDRFAVDLGVGTVVPLYLGVQAQAELTARILIRAEIGWMPGSYVDIINAGATALNAYNDETADLLRDGIEDSLILRFSAGHRPLEDYGLEILAGYTLGTLGGSAATVEVVEAVIGSNLSNVNVNSASDIDLSSTMHAAHVELAYRWIVGDDWVLRASVGYVHVFSSSTQADLNLPAGRLREASTTPLPEVEAYLDDLYTSYVRSPVVGVIASYRF